MRHVKCAVCGKEFDTRHATKTTCSEECSLELHRIRAKKPQYEKTCVVCGKRFMAWKKTQEACGKECGNLLAGKRRSIEKDTYRQVDMRMYHSDSLDRKAKKWGFEYGKRQSEQTLAEVGKVDVNGILRELSAPKPKPQPIVKEEPKGRTKKCRNCGKKFPWSRKLYCCDWCRNYAKVSKAQKRKEMARACL